MLNYVQYLCCTNLKKKGLLFSSLYFGTMALWKQLQYSLVVLAVLVACFTKYFFHLFLLRIQSLLHLVPFLMMSLSAPPPTQEHSLGEWEELLTINDLMK